MSAMIDVMLVDDHAVVREGYRRLLERTDDIRVAAEAACGADAYAAFVREPPDVVVMDIALPDVGGIEAMRRILQRDSKARVLVFSIHDEAVFAERALHAGARGYLTKASAPELLVRAVRTVAAGETFLSPDIAHALALRGVFGRDDDALRALSDREFEIVRLLALGLSIRDIAERLCLNSKTVSNYQSLIRNKLGAQTPAQLLRIAARHGLVPGGEP